MKDRKKPEKFWLPHGMPSDDRAFAFSSRVFPKASQIKTLYKLWHYQLVTRRAVVGSEAALFDKLFEVFWKRDGHGACVARHRVGKTKNYWFSGISRSTN